MKKGVYTRFTLVVLFLSIILGCAATSTQKEIILTHESAPTLNSGMEVSEIENLFGKPDTTYIMIFGKNAGATWEGLVYKYYGPPDTLYSYAKRQLTNVFVFYTGTNPPKLNHWNIEYTLGKSKK